MNYVPQSGTMRIMHHVVYVKVKVEMTSSEDLSTEALCAVAAAVEGLEVPEASVLDVRTEPWVPAA